MAKPPLVSVALPLHRSRPFLEIVLENLQALTWGNLEIIVSDRHLADDTLDVLRSRFASDARFRFLEARDHLDWVGHFNLLLAEARGEYFMWMAHDDSYPASYIAKLVACLEEHRAAVLAFGEVEQVSLDGFLPTLPFVPPPVAADEDWSIDAAVRCLTLWQLWIAFRGVFRRDVVARSGLYIRPTRGNVRADVYWVFALSLTGALRFVPSCRMTKRFHRGSGGAGWRFGIRQSLDACRVLGSYLDDFARSPREATRAKSVVYPWCLVQGLLPERWARGLGIATRRILLPSAMRAP